MWGTVWLVWLKWISSRNNVLSFTKLLKNAVFKMPILTFSFTSGLWPSLKYFLAKLGKRKKNPDIYRALWGSRITDIDHLTKSKTQVVDLKRKVLRWWDDLTVDNWPVFAPRWTNSTSTMDLNANRVTSKHNL